MLDPAHRATIQAAGVVRYNKDGTKEGSGKHGILNKKRCNKISLWDAIWDSAMLEQKYAEFLAMVYSEMADAVDDEDFIDPMLKYADLVDAELWAKAFILWGTRCLDAGTVRFCCPLSSRSPNDVVMRCLGQSAF
jgi:hypothetical protein